MQAIVPFPITQWPGVVTIEMPEGAYVLSVRVHEDTPHLWALTDPNRPDAEFVFHVRQSFEHYRHDEHGEDYIGTFQDPHKEPLAAYVFHVFKARPTKSVRETEEDGFSESEDYW